MNETLNPIPNRRRVVVRTLDRIHAANLRVDVGITPAQILSTARERWNLPTEEQARYAIIEAATSKQLDLNRPIGEQVEDDAELTIVPSYTAA